MSEIDHCLETVDLLGYKKESKIILNVLEQAEQEVLFEMVPCTLESLQTALSSNHSDIIHCCGHGNNIEGHEMALEN